jgi:hypothetical protein
MDLENIFNGNVSNCGKGKHKKCIFYFCCTISKVKLGFSFLEKGFLFA